MSNIPQLSNIRDRERDLNENEGLQQTISDLEDMLSVKQMEIDILTMLDRHRAAAPQPMVTDHLARYILALSALCKDPKRFYNHDLINTLQHNEPPADDEFALSTLAACSSSTHVRKKQIRRLLDIASGEITNIGRSRVSMSNLSFHSFELSISKLFSLFLCCSCRHNGVSFACFTLHNNGS